MSSWAAPWDGNYLPLLELPPDRRSVDFSTLLGSAVPSPQAARELATGQWLREHGLLAEEALQITSLYRADAELEGFARRDDWLWEVRVLHLGLGLDGVLWINSRTRAVKVLAPGR